MVLCAGEVLDIRFKAHLNGCYGLRITYQVTYLIIVLKYRNMNSHILVLT